MALAVLCISLDRDYLDELFACSMRNIFGPSAREDLTYQCWFHMVGYGYLLSGLYRCMMSHLIANHGAMFTPRVRDIIVFRGPLKDS